MVQIDETTLTKGQLRKLNALRKSIGDKIADGAFSEWLSSQSAAAEPATDKNADLIADTLWDLVRDGRLALPRSGYLVKRGRRRVIVEPAS